VDGIKVRLDEQRWVHLSPNPEKPRFEIVAEGIDDADANALVDEYRQLLHDIIENNRDLYIAKKDER
jgi:mannose-1-phosphate guanylyltransferase/phosphomannomutase